MNTTATLEELSEHLPPAWPHELLEQIRGHCRKTNERIVVLDDDPTGTQSVHDVPVVMRWDAEMLAETLAEASVCFVLTNSRSLSEADAVSLARIVGANIRTVERELGVPIRVASRSDSTLRGHFPAEVDGLAEGLEEFVDAYLLCPALPEGGRHTAEDVHWVADEFGRLVPVGETPFARDATFGFKSSRLTDWVEEKSGGKLRAADVASIGLKDIRTGGPERVADLLVSLSRAVIIVNALCYRDLEVVAAGTQIAEAWGRRFLYRCAAGFVRVRGGIGERPLLRRDEVLPSTSRRGGLVVCGSHVPLSTAQVLTALALPHVEGIELPVDKILSAPDVAEGILARAAATTDAYIEDGKTVVLYTSRDLYVPSDLSPLEAGRRVMRALVRTVERVKATPAFVVGKGGITSSDLATHVLCMERATVLGQIVPGVPVWRADKGLGAGRTLIVVPGNVGTKGTLAEIITVLSEAQL